MKLLNVVNVGQGNCIVIAPTDGCEFNQKELIFDLGDGQTDISRHLSPRKHKEVFLSHYHKDHIGGVCEFMLRYGDLIDHIWLPLYQNEIMLIAKAILKLKGMKSISNEYTEYFKDMLSFHSLLKRANKSIQFVYSGQTICQHLKVFNPIVDFEANFEPSREDIQQVVGLFEEPFQQQMEMYLTSNNDYVPDAPELYKHIINPHQQTGFNSKRHFVYNFFINNLSAIHSFNSNPSLSLFNKIKGKHILTSHQACSVFRYDLGGISCLLPGDADLTVMKRLVKDKKDIQSKYFVLPHHGSKRNIDEKVLQYIQPFAAVLSHDNAKFGRSKDTHPHREVLDMLKANGVRILSTNDIVKDGTILFDRFSENHSDRYIQLLR